MYSLRDIEEGAAWLRDLRKQVLPTPERPISQSLNPRENGVTLWFQDEHLTRSELVFLDVARNQLGDMLAVQYGAGTGRISGCSTYTGLRPSISWRNGDL